MDRRTFLAAVPLAASGCLGDAPGRSSGTPAATDAREAPGASVAVATAYRYVHEDDALGVDAPTRAVFAFVRPPASAAGAPPDDFALELGDGRFTPLGSVPGRSLTPGVAATYTDATRSGWLVFDLPAVDADRGALTADGTAAPLPDAALRRVAAPPALSLDSVSVPETVSPYEPVTVRLVVSNDGGHAGSLLVGFESGGWFGTAEATVPAGDATRASVTVDRTGRAGDTVRFGFVHAGGRTRHEVRVVSDRQSVGRQAPPSSSRS